MTDNNHPITPPLELIAKWAGSMSGYYEAARWGADQELEACCEWVSQWCGRWSDGTRPEDELRAARRPKPLSLRELALASVKRFEESGEFFSDQMRELEFIRKALEQLDD